MSDPKPIPNFDCLAFKWRVQEEIYEETKDMSPEEEIAYYQKAVQEGPFRDLWNSLKARNEAEVTRSKTLGLQK
jgi:hypothetical protein